jgi:myo-inositol-1-phosphate synthase
MKSPLLLIAGAKGAVGTTIAAAVDEIKCRPGNTIPWLTTAHWVPENTFSNLALAGWDPSDKTMIEALEHQEVLPPDRYQDNAKYLEKFDIRKPPAQHLALEEKICFLSAEIQEFMKSHPDNQPVLVNLLPASEVTNLGQYRSLDEIFHQDGTSHCPDLAYIIAAIQCGVPIVNFTSNAVECPILVQEAIKAGVPMCGRDGKTGQTYLKVVIASALKVRNLLVDGWYSLNILGNDDGKNLSNPQKASGKLANKTEFLDTILGYQVGERYGRSTHKVAIDYYPPRGDCKESWDVIDITGIFGMPMSLRLNMQLRDSILAAPMVIDLAVWMSALHAQGCSGLIPELAFYFKKTVGLHPPISFQDQTDALRSLEQFCRGTVEKENKTGEGRL